MISLTPTSTLVDDYIHYWDGDPAFDQNAEGFAAEYEKALDSGDWSHVPRKEGAGEPTGFKLRHFRGNVRRHVQDLAQGGQIMKALRRVAALALRGVVHLPDPRNEGQDYKITLELDAEGFECAATKHMDELDRFSPALVNSIGQRALREMNLSKN